VCPVASRGITESKMLNKDTTEFGFHAALPESECLHDIVLSPMTLETVRPKVLCRGDRGQSSLTSVQTPLGLATHIEGGMGRGVSGPGHTTYVWS